MKQFIPASIITLLLMLALASCSQNTFKSRKNYQPRVKIESQRNDQLTNETINVNALSTEKIIINNSANISKKDLPQNKKRERLSKPKTPLIEKLVEKFFPKQKRILDELKKKNGYKLSKSKGTQMDDAHITGLVLSLLALVMAISAMMMIIGMAHSNLWIYFAVGCILAAVSITLAFITKSLLPFKGISLAAGTLGVIAIVMLIIFMVLIVAGVVF